MRDIRIILAQTNPRIGDISGNTEQIIKTLKSSTGSGAEVIVFPELAITGYPPKDLLLYEEIITANTAALKAISPHTKAYTAVIIGYCKRVPQGLHNAYAVFQDGTLTSTGAKICLPQYEEFDECRYFIPGEGVKAHRTANFSFGVIICEDLWHTETTHPHYPLNPLNALKQQGVEIVFVLNASPYSIGKRQKREAIIRRQAQEHKIIIAYVNTWGSNDELLFDGGSLFCDQAGKIITQAEQFTGATLIGDFSTQGGIHAKHYTPTLRVKTQSEEIYEALIMAKQDYHKKTGIEGSVIGISGGIDSAITLAIDSTALSPQRVLGILSPSRYTSQATFEDSKKLCKSFGITHKTLPIDNTPQFSLHSSLMSTKEDFLTKQFGTLKNPKTLENQQAISRMSILRAIANEEGRLITGSSNKSELAMGYATLCGDLHADIIPLGDLYKTQIYTIAEHINKTQGAPIPQSIIDRAPTAELTSQQEDPFPYPELDHFLRLRIEERKSLTSIYAELGAKDTISRKKIDFWEGLLRSSEHKRQSAGLIFKINAVSFGSTWRMSRAQRIRIL